MDYCSRCGKAAVIRCPRDGTFACEEHAADYPHLPIRRVLGEDGWRKFCSIENPPAKLCADCIDKTMTQLVPLFAEVLMARYSTQERATVGFIDTGLEWNDLTGWAYPQYRSTVSGHEVVLAMGGKPSWLRMSAQHTLAALFAETAPKSGCDPTPVEFRLERVSAPRRFNKNRSETRSVPSALAWPIAYIDCSSDYSRALIVYVRLDGDLSRPYMYSQDGGHPKGLGEWARDVGGAPARPANQYPDTEVIKALATKLKELMGYGRRIDPEIREAADGAEPRHASRRRPDRYSSDLFEFDRDFIDKILPPLKLRDEALQRRYEAGREAVAEILGVEVDPENTDTQQT